MNEFIFCNNSIQLGLLFSVTLVLPLTWPTLIQFIIDCSKQTSTLFTGVKHPMRFSWSQGGLKAVKCSAYCVQPYHLTTSKVGSKNLTSFTRKIVFEHIKEFFEHPKSERGERQGRYFAWLVKYLCVLKALPT